jgi:cytidine deaminase
MPLDATVHLLAEQGARATMTLEELLPRSFGPEYLP